MMAELKLLTLGVIAELFSVTQFAELFAEIELDTGGGTTATAGIEIVGTAAELFVTITLLFTVTRFV
jgi:hypothetical protein